jgi:hypothetical protein
MADSNVYQSKRKKLVFSSETSTGDWEELNASSFQVPAFDISIARDRGTQMLERSGLMDGEAGEMCSVPGSFASSLSFSSEIHPVSGGANYFIRLLQACGFSGSNAGSVMTMTPSTAVITDYAATSPNSLSFGLIHQIDGINDTLQRMTGSTGAASFVFNAGERAQIDFNFVGINGDFIDVSAADLSATGSTTGIGCTPFVVKSIQAVLTGADSPTAIDEVELASITINTNAETPDVLDPTKENGFGTSPVFWNTAPTVSFEIAATSVNNLAFWQKFKAGQTISMALTMTDTATSRAVAVTLSKIQFTNVSMQDKNGFESYSIEGKVVRDVGTTYATSGNLFSIAYTY